MRAWYSKASLAIVCAALLGAHAARGAEHAVSRTSFTLLSSHGGPAAMLSVDAMTALLQKEFRGQQALQSWICTPLCGVRVYKFVYATIGGEGEATDASWAP